MPTNFSELNRQMDNWHRSNIGAVERAHLKAILESLTHQGVPPLNEAPPTTDSGRHSFSHSTIPAIQYRDQYETNS